MERVGGRFVSSLLWMGLISGALVLGCGGGAANSGSGGGGGSSGGSSGGGTGGATACSGGAPAGWPGVLIARGGTDPALYAGPDDSAPAFGYLSEGVRLRVDCPPNNGRVAVTVGGSMVVHGWVPITRTMVYAAQRARIDGTPVYLGENDPIGLMAAESDGSFRVDLRVRLGREGAADIGPFSGIVAADMLRDRPSFEGVDPGLNAGEPMRLPAATAVQVFDRPNGAVIATLPVLDPPLTVVVMRSRDEWHGVRIGVGPYLVGYVQGTLEASTMEAVGTRPGAISYDVADGEMPGRIAREDDGTLVRVAAGTEIFFYGEDVGRVRGSAWGREFSRQDDEVDVYIAVDDGVAIRGIVPADAVTPVREGTDGAE